MTRHSRLFVELAALATIVVALGAGAFAVQKLLVPSRLATTDIARSIDNALGPLILRQVELSQDALSNPAVDKAFAIIMNRLKPALDQLAPEGPAIRIVVIDSPEINAFTLPGGIICVCTGIMRDLDSADQMAAILGHELSHAVHRDPLALLMRRVGVAALARVLTGGRGGDLARRLAQTLVGVHYGREAEDRADAFSVQLLALAGIPPLSFAQALEHIRKVEPKDPGLLQWIDAHSPIDERIARAREQAEKLSVTARRIDLNWTALIRKLSKSAE